MKPGMLSVTAHLLVAVSGCLLASCSVVEAVVEDINALCTHTEYRVTTQEFHGERDSLCDVSSGTCSSVKAALNTANLCRDYGRKTIELQTCGVYVMRAQDVPSQLIVGELRDLGGEFRQSASPVILGEVVIAANGAILQAEADTTSQLAFFVAPSGSLEIHGTVISDLAVVNQGSLRLSRVAMVNPKRGEKPAIWNEGELLIEDRSLFAANYGWAGSDIANYGNALFEESTITSSLPAGLGLPLTTGLVIPSRKHSSILNYGTFELRNSTIDDLDVSFAAIANITGELTISNSTFSDIGLDFEGVPIGVEPDGSLVLSDMPATIILDRADGPLDISSSTFADSVIFNVIRKRADGEIARVSLRDLTISGIDLAPMHEGGHYDPLNFALDFAGNIDLVIGNTVVATDNGVNCRFDSLFRINRLANHANDSSCGFTSVGDPRLGALANNDGFNLTKMPQATSPLLDQGASVSFEDQRLADRSTDGDGDGVARPDIGAVERGADSPIELFAPGTYGCSLLLPTRPFPIPPELLPPPISAP